MIFQNQLNLTGMNTFRWIWGGGLHAFGSQCGRINGLLAPHRHWNVALRRSQRHGTVLRGNIPSTGQTESGDWRRAGQPPRVEIFHPTQGHSQHVTKRLVTYFILRIFQYSAHEIVIIPCIYFHKHLLTDFFVIDWNFQERQHQPVGQENASEWWKSYHSRVRPRYDDTGYFHGRPRWITEHHLRRYVPTCCLDAKDIVQPRSTQLWSIRSIGSMETGFNSFFFFFSHSYIRQDPSVGGRVQLFIL